MTNLHEDTLDAINHDIVSECLVVESKRYQKDNIRSFSYGDQRYLIKFMGLHDSLAHEENSRIFTNLDVPFIPCKKVSFTPDQAQTVLLPREIFHMQGVVMPFSPWIDFGRHLDEKYLAQDENKKFRLTQDEKEGFCWSVLHYAVPLIIGGFWDMEPRNVLVDRSENKLRPVFVDAAGSFKDEGLNINDESLISEMGRNVLGFYCHYIDNDRVLMDSHGKTEIYRDMLQQGTALCVEKLATDVSITHKFSQTDHAILKKRADILQHIVTDKDVWNYYF